jgi:hypothetical protein
MARDIKQMKPDGIYKTGMMSGMKKGMKKGKKVENDDKCPSCGKKKSECGCDYDD